MLLNFTLPLPPFSAFALLLYLLIRYYRRPDPEKYILDIDPDDDIRENVMNYNEEGAGTVIGVYISYGVN